MSIPDLLSITVDATLGSQARISPLLVMVNKILLLEATLCLASTFQRQIVQNCRKITVHRPSINGAFHWITAHQRNRQIHPRKKVSVGW